MFRRGRNLKLSLFAGADYATRCDDRRSVSGVAAMLRNTDVSASNTTQYCMTLSTSEAEYVAIDHGTKNAVAIKAVLDFVQPYLSSSVIHIYEDNEGDHILAKNAWDFHHSQHIGVRRDFLRGAVKLRQVTPNIL